MNVRKIRSSKRAAQPRETQQQQQLKVYKMNRAETYKGSLGSCRQQVALGEHDCLEPQSMCSPREVGAHISMEVREGLGQSFRLAEMPSGRCIFGIGVPCL